MVVCASFERSHSCTAALTINYRDTVIIARCVQLCYTRCSILHRKQTFCLRIGRPYLACCNVRRDEAPRDNRTLWWDLPHEVFNKLLTTLEFVNHGDDMIIKLAKQMSRRWCQPDSCSRTWKQAKAALCGK